MSVNNFENNVQQKMDELLLKPSAQVWEEVERRIREKKRRRIIFWFLLPGLLLLGGGAWWKLSQPTAENDIAVIETTKQNKIENDQKTENTELKTVKDVNEKNNDAIVSGSEPDTKTKPQTEEKRKAIDIREPATPPASLNKSAGKLANKQDVKEKQKKSIDIEKIIPGENANTNLDNSKKIATGIDKKNDVISNPERIAQVANDVQVKKDDIPTKITNDTISTVTAGDIIPVETKKSEPVVSLTDSLIQPISTETVSGKNKKKKNKWELGLTGSIGNSKLNNKRLLGDGLKSYDAALSAPTTGSGSFNSSFADSIPLKGLAWQLGAFAKRNLSKKISYSVGLNFSYYSTKQTVGLYVDSIRTVNNDLRSVTSGGFYRSGSFNNYVNKYYYVQVPVLLNWQINKGNKLPPFIWENGFSPSFMIGSNALVYDKSTKLFFKDKRVYNNFSLLFHTGFTAKLFADKKHPMSAGLFYDHHLSMLQKVNPPNYNYLSSFGVKINWLIKK